ncbi:hypothetical protein SCHPADRAFT_335177 [Schizopora paradoxa]|uniref:Uncharacterized protein n=1 Tax=Schizopora paradoxa TaxID=27342 RepID=A0A0H2RPY5_9AGAM|nr:hypothetical protein SCHPADRAFT_335177 [Schizopora paradoxa]
MDIDIPVSSSHVDVRYGDIPRSAGGYVERTDGRAKDSTPTAPRAMAVKSSGPLLPQPPFGPKGSGGSRFAQDNGWPVRDRPPTGGQRSSRFAETQQLDEQRPPPITRDAVDRQGGAPERPTEPLHRTLPPPSGLKPPEKSSRHGPSPKLTGSNNIAVPPTKGWTVNPSRKDDPPPFIRDERQPPPHMKSSSRWESSRNGAEELGAEVPLRVERTQSAPYSVRRDEYMNRPVLMERLSSSDRIALERGPSRLDEDVNVPHKNDSRRVCASSPEYATVSAYNFRIGQ